MGRKKKDLDDAFFGDFEAMDEDGATKEGAEEQVAAPGKHLYFSWVTLASSFLFS